MSRRALALCALAALSSACASRVIPMEAGSFRNPALADPAKKMLVLQSQDAGRPTEVIGVIDVHEPSGSQDAALMTLKERAALLGADAVIGVEFHHEEPSSEAEHKDIETHLSGLAVRFRPVLQNKPYDVVGQLQVDADMEHEDDGLKELREKADGVRADALLDVQFHHGEASRGKTRLTAIAIRYR